MDASERHERMAKFMPTPEYIAHMKRIIRAENEAARHGKKPQPMSDDDCDHELEALADKDSMRNGR